MSVRVVKCWRPAGKVLMYADILFSGTLETRGWRLLKDKANQYFVGYPNSPVGDGKRIRQVIPRTEELQQEIKQTLIRTYEGLGDQYG